MPIQKLIPATRTYRDIDLNFTKHPVTRDISVLNNEDAIKRSVRNLVLLSFYEKPFHHEIGSGVRQTFFENNLSLTSMHLKRTIEDVINNYEPRASLSDVVCQFTPDENRVEVIIQFFINNLINPVEISVFLERVR